MLILLISFSLCEIEIKELERYKSIEFNSRQGMIYLNIEEFEIYSTIHILFNTDGELKKEIQFEFNDTKPIHDYSLSDKMNFTTQSNYVKQNKKTIKYYYDIKKKENKKYLIFKFFNVNAKNIIIENTEINLMITIVIIISIVFACLVITIIITAFICIRKKRIKEQTKIDYNDNNLTNQENFNMPLSDNQNTIS